MARKAGSGRLLTEAEVRERSIAGRASAQARARRHPAETAPSVRQGGTSPPSPRAIGLFRQGQQRPDTRARRGAFDTRSTEPTVGAVHASFTLHFPKAYRSATPDPPPRGRHLLAMTLGAKKPGEPQDLIVRNPATLAEAHRHPAMREILTNSIGLVREHQKGTIERGHARKLIPEGTRPGLVARAYKHAALLAVHKTGLGDYDFHMDEAAKADFRPLVPFMRYAHRRVFDQLHVANKGKFQAFKDEFGVEYRQKKHGKLTGVVHPRLRPNHEFIKLELGDLSEPLEKSWTNATGVIRAPGSPTEVENADRTTRPTPTRSESGSARIVNEHERDTHSVLPIARAALASAEASQGPHGALLHRLKIAKPVPELPHGAPPIAGASTHIKAAAQAVEDHFGVPRIGGSARNAPNRAQPRVTRRNPAQDDADTRSAAHDGADNLKKLDLGFRFGSEPPNPNLGGYNTNPATQLKRAMRPRLRQRRFRLRLNTQRHLRVALGGGITRQERWQLGATPRVPKSFYKRAPVTKRVTKAAARYTPDGTPQEHCGKCEHFQAPATCNKVQGPVVPGGWCRFFDAVTKGVTKSAFGHISGEYVRGTFNGPLNVRRTSNPPLKVQKRTPIDDVAATATRPTPGQAAAGNYRMGHVSVGGLDVSIETPRGRWRHGASKATGRRWSVRMPAHYGYIKRTEGADGDHLDVYLGPHAHQAEKHPVFVVDQQHADTKRFDEHKAMVGFRDRAHASAAYDAAFSDKRGPDRRRDVHELTLADFKHWVGHGDTTKPYGTVRKPDTALNKGIVGDAVRFGATYLAPIARAAGRSSTGGRIGSSLGGFGRRVAQSRVGTSIAGTANQVANHPAVAAVANHPRVAPALSEARDLRWKGLVAPLHATGRIAGAAAGGPRGARIGGNLGLAADYAPVAYTAASAGQALHAAHGDKDKRKPLPAAKTLTQHVTDRVLGKGLAGAAIGAIGRAGPKTKAGLALGAGLAAAPVAHYTRDHPGARTAVGAGLAGGAAALVTRGRAVRGVKAASRALYTTGMKDALREHLRILGGAAQSPHHVAQQQAAFRAIRHRIVADAKSNRAAGMAAIHPAKKIIAGAAAVGGATGLATSGRNRWTDLPQAGTP